MLSVHSITLLWAGPTCISNWVVSLLYLFSRQTLVRLPLFLHSPVRPNQTWYNKCMRVGSGATALHRLRMRMADLWRVSSEEFRIAGLYVHP